MARRGRFPLRVRSYWIPGSYAPALSEKCNSLLRLLKNKGFKEESMTKVGVYAIDTSTTLESNKSLRVLPERCLTGYVYPAPDLAARPTSRALIPSSPSDT